MGGVQTRVALEVDVPGYYFFPSNLLMLHLAHLDTEVDGEFRDLLEPVRLPGCVAVPGADILQPLQDRRSDTSGLSGVHTTYSTQWLAHIIS